MSRSPQDGLSVWIIVLILALISVLASGLAALLPAQLEYRESALGGFARSMLPLAVAVVIAVLALWASRLLVDAARREAARELEFAQMRAELALAQKAREQRHDLLNHLTVVSALIQMGAGEQAQAYLQRAIHNQPEEAAASHRENDPAVLLGLMGQKLPQAARLGVDLELHVENRADRLCIPDVVAARIMGNLTDNAIDAAGEGGGSRGKVVAELLLSGDRCRLRVWNNGAVIPPDKLKRIFAAGQTTKGGEHQGLGLHIVQQLVRDYGGSLAVRSDAEAGTEFIVEFDGPSRPEASKQAASLGFKLRSGPL